MYDNKDQELAHATARAKGALATANRQAERIREAADQLVAAGSKLAATGSEVLGGVLGGSLCALAGLVLSPWSPILIPAVPLLGVAGICAGILAVRGRPGVRQDRERRNRLLNDELSIRSARGYREEISSAISSGAPDGGELWEGYIHRLPEPSHHAQLLIETSAPDIELGSKILPPVSEVPALEAANPSPQADG